MRTVIIAIMIAVSFYSVHAATNITDCTVISASGEYLLTADILDSSSGNCIQINSSDVIFNGLSHTVDGKDSWGSIGISTVPGIKNVTLLNLILTDWDVGLYVSNLSNSTLENITISSHVSYGIAIRSSANITFRSTTVEKGSSFSSEGINVQDSENLTFINLTSSENYANDGVDFSNTNNTLLKDCNISANGANGVYLDHSINITIEGCTIYGNSHSGISFFHSYKDRIYKNTIKENTWEDIEFQAYGLSDCNNLIENNTGSGDRPIIYLNTSSNLSNSTFSQLILCGANNSSIVNITVAGSPALDNNGIKAYYTNYTEFLKVNSSWNFRGIMLSDSYNNKIDGATTLYNKKTGISLRYSYYNTIANSTSGYTDWDEGISLWHSGYNTVINNTVNSSADDGILLGFSSNHNTVTENRLNSNDGSGIYVSTSDYNNISYNHLYLNNIHITGSDSNSLISNTVVAGSGDGIYIGYSSNYNTVENNTVSKSSTGIYLYYSDSNTLRRNNLSKSDTGLYLYSSKNCYIENNTITENRNYDLEIYADDSSYCPNTIVNNTGSGGREIGYFSNGVNISNTTFSLLILCNADSSNISNVTVSGSSTYRNNGIELVYTSGADIYNVTSSGNKIGIMLYYSANNSLGKIVAMNNSDYGVKFYYSDGNILTNSKIKENLKYGVYLYGAENSTLSDSLLEENSEYDLYLYSSSPSICNSAIKNLTLSGGRPLGFFTGRAEINNSVFSLLILCNADNSTVENVSIYGSSTKKNNGIYLLFTDNATLINTSSYNNYRGIELEKSNNNTISNGNFLYNTYGVALSDSSYNLISSSTVYNSSQDGVYLSSSSYNTINTSNISRNGNYGIFLMSSDRNTFHTNTIVENTYGIYTGFSQYNLIYDNLFRNRQENADTIDYFQNYWNTTKKLKKNIINGSYTGGNVWLYLNGSGFSSACSDPDSDGICNTSYKITEDNTDYLPLKYSAPLPWSNITGCTGINSPGYYVVQSDLQGNGSCINITSGDVVLDGGWHRIEGADTKGSAGISISPGIKNITLRNLVLTRWDTGVYSVNTSRLNLENLTLYKNIYGVFLSNSSDTWLSKINSSFNTKYGVYIQNSENIDAEHIVADYNSQEDGVCLLYSPNATLLNITARGNPYGSGIYLGNSPEATVINSTLMHNSYGMEIYYSANSTISGNYIAQNNNNGIEAYRCEGSNFTQNTAYNNTLSGIHADSSNSTLFYRNNLTKNRDGITVIDSSSVRILNNTAREQNFLGIKVRGDDSRVTDNYVDGAGDVGIEVEVSSGVLVSGNTLKNTDGIIVTTGSKNCTVSRNLLENAGDGIYILYSNTTTVEYNTINNSTYGIVLDGYNNIARYNTISNATQGLYFHNSYNSTAHANTVLNSTEGIVLSYSTGNTVENSTISADKHIIQFYGTASYCSNTLKNITDSSGREALYYTSAVNLSGRVLSQLVLCNASGSNIHNVTIYGSGVLMLFTDNSSFSSTAVRGAYMGFELYYSDRSSFTDITGESNTYSFYLKKSSNNNFTGVNITGGNYGIYLNKSSARNTLINSRIQGASTGIFIDGWLSSDNLFYNNYFRNKENVKFRDSLPPNQWNTTKQSGVNIVGGSTVGGNYWSNLAGNGYSDTCSDADIDGICDSPYNINISNTDYFPLSKGGGAVAITDCTTLTQPGYYMLGGDITAGAFPCIKIESDNVTLDGRGHKINGINMLRTWSKNDTSGVYASTMQNITLINITIANWSTGIKFENVNSSRIAAVKVRDCKNRGIGLSGYNNTVENSSFRNTTQGLSIDGGTTTVRGNSFEGDGLLLENFYGGNTVVNNTVNGRALVYLENISGRVVSSAGQVILVDTTNVTLRGINIKDVYQGVLIANSPNTTVESTDVSATHTGVSIRGNSQGTLLRNVSAANNSESGIFIFSDNVSLTDCTLYGNLADGVEIAGEYTTVINCTIHTNGENGIEIWNDYVDVENCTIYNNGNAGIHLLSGSYATLQRNTLKNNRNYSIDLSISDNVVIRDNTLQASQKGIDIFFSDNVTVAGNTISESQTGLYTDSKNGTVVDNRIINNTQGIYIAFGAKYNRIYNNYLNNTVNARISDFAYVNYWNTTLQNGTSIAGGSLLGGNLWAEPDGTGYSESCSDVDNNSICDSPYNLTADWKNVDYLPLAYRIDTIPPEINFVAPTPVDGATLNTSHVLINITSSENLGSAILEWNGTNSSMSGSGTSWYINVTSLSAGSYTYRVYGEDFAGNWNVTEARSVRISPQTVYTVIKGCTVINSSGYYYLDNDIINASDTCITINAGNVTFDGRGHVIDGKDSGSGISVSNQNNITLINSIIRDFRYGIYLSHSSTNTISNTTVDNSLYGVYLYYSSGNTIANSTIADGMYGVYSRYSTGNNITNTTITGTSSSGVDLYRSSGTTIAKSTISSNGYGVYIDTSSSNTILVNSTISGNRNGGVVIFRSYTNIIANNTFTGNGIYYIFDTPGDTVENNTVNGKPLVYIKNTANITVHNAGEVIAINSTNITVKNLNLSNTDVGVQFINVHNSTIADNTISSNLDDGIYIRSSSDNTITNNTINNSEDNGISLYFSSSNTITNNKISNSRADGVYIYSSIGNTVANNTITDNKDDGVAISSSSSNTIVGNTITNSQDNGVYIGSSSSSNIITNNTISNNGNRGVAIESSSRNTVANNTITGSQNNGISIYFSSSSNTIANNRVSNNRYMGVYIGSSSNTVINNTITSNNHSGVYIYTSSSNTIANNTITNNNYTGIYIDSYYASSYNNLIYNNLFNNTNNFYFRGTIYNNSWNTSLQAGRSIVGGSYIGGNFWANPNGTGYSESCSDVDNNSICDSPYNLTADWKNVDYLPLTYYHPPDTVPPAITLYSPENTTYSTGTVSINVSASEPISQWWYSLDNSSNVTFIPNTTLNLSEGAHSLIVYANDTSGNVNSTEVYFTVDTTPPAIAFVPPTPGSGALVESPVVVNITSSEKLGSVLLEVDGSNLSMNLSGTGAHTNISLSEGFHTYRVYASDPYGNTGSTGLRNLTVVKIARNLSSMNRTFKFDLSDAVLQINATAPLNLNLSVYVARAAAIAPEINKTTTEGRADKGIKYLKIENNTAVWNISRVKVEIHFTQAELGGISPDSVEMFYWNGTRWVSVFSSNGSVIPDSKGGLRVYDCGRYYNSATGKGYVYAEVNHTSVFGLGGSIAYVSAQPLPSTGVYHPEVVILANSIDLGLADDLISALQKAGIDVLIVDANNFSTYSKRSYVIILGGHKAYEGIGEIVDRILNSSEKERIELGFVALKKKSVFRSGGRVYIFAGRNRSYTAEAWRERLVDLVREIKYNTG